MGHATGVTVTRPGLAGAQPELTTQTVADRTALMMLAPAAPALGSSVRSRRTDRELPGSSAPGSP